MPGKPKSEARWGKRAAAVVASAGLVLFNNGNSTAAPGAAARAVHQESRSHPDSAVVASARHFSNRLLQSMVSIETTSTTTPPPTLPAGEKPYYTPQKTIYSAPYNPPEQAALSKWVASALPRDGLVALALTKQVKALYTGTIVVAIKGHDCAADVNLQLFQGKKGPTVLITDNYAARPSDMTNYGEVTGPDMYSSPRPIFVHGDTDLALTTPDQETQVTAPSNSVNTVIGGILELNDNACENLPPPTTTTTTTLP